jgi:hypothetical protein
MLATDRDTSWFNVRLGAALLPMALTAGVASGYDVVQQDVLQGWLLQQDIKRQWAIGAT